MVGRGHLGRSNTITPLTSDMSYVCAKLLSSSAASFKPLKIIFHFHSHQNTFWSLK